MPTRLTLVAAAVTALVFLGAEISYAGASGPAASARDKFRSGDTVTIAESETVRHDLYIAGGTVTVAGRIEGDLFVAGGTVNVTGPVTGDVFIGGGNIMVDGAVGRHLRIGGGNVAVDGPVEMDLLAAAGTLHAGPSAQVGGDLIFNGGQLTLDGKVAGSVLASVGSYSRTGAIGGAEDVTLQESMQRRVEPARQIGGHLIDQFQRYVGILVVGAVLLWRAPKFLHLAASCAREHPLPSAGWGVLGMVAFLPILLALLIVMITLAVPLSLLGLTRLLLAAIAGILLAAGALSYVMLVVALFVAVAIVGLAVGQLALARIARPADRRQAVLMLAVGTLAIVTATALPYVGWVAHLVVVAVGLGATLIVLRQRSGVRTASGQPG